MKKIVISLLIFLLIPVSFSYIDVYKKKKFVSEILCNKSYKEEKDFFTYLRNKYKTSKEQSDIHFWENVANATSCPHYHTPSVIEYNIKYPEDSFWENIQMEIDRIIPFVPLKVYLLAKKEGYDVVDKTVFNGVSYSRLYNGKYKIYRARNSIKLIKNANTYNYILVRNHEVKFYEETETKFSEISSCMP